MSDPNLPGPIDELMAVKQLHPELIDAVQTQVLGLIHIAEKTYTEPKMGAVKSQYVTNQATELFEQVADALVDAASLIPGFPMPIALILKTVVIPALPTWTAQIVHGLNAAGIFKK